MGRAKLHTEAPAPDNGAKILQFKIWLKGISPMIWRRVQTPASTTLRELHGIFGDAARSVQNCTLSGMELEKVVAGAPLGTQRCDEA
jgi:hypothetical protein